MTFFSVDDERGGPAQLGVVSVWRVKTVWVLGEDKEGVGLDCGELHPTAHSTRKKYNYKTAHRYTVNVYVH